MAPEDDPLNPEHSGGVTYVSQQPRSLHILGMGLSVLAARWLSALLLIVAMAGLGTIAWRIESARRAGEGRWIDARYSDLILSTRVPPESDGLEVIPAGSFEDLVRVAKRNNLLITRWVDGGRPHFAVRQAQRLFYYEAADSPPAGMEDNAGRPGEGGTA